MGNATSCAPSITSSSGVAKVLYSNGHLETYTNPVKAGELMAENPGEFICDSTRLKIGQRVHGLSADEQLERRHFYFLLPMELLYSVLTQEEMTSLTLKATKAMKTNNFVKIFPALTEFCIFPSDAMAMADSSAATDEAETVERYSKQRSWKPALETIVETPPCRKL